MKKTAAPVLNTYGSAATLQKDGAHTTAAGAGSLASTTSVAALRQGGSLVNETRAAVILDVKVSTLRRWRWSGDGPAFRKIGRCVRYCTHDLDAFVEAARRISTSDIREA